MTGTAQPPFQAAIIGGGIGGLTAALALRRVGLGVTVFEREPHLRELGAGLTLWTNAVKVLDQLDLGVALRAASMPLERFDFWSWRGKRLGTIPLGELAATLGAPCLGIHRADLLALLAQAVSEGPVRLGARCVGFELAAVGADGDAGGICVRVHFADGRVETRDLLIGADGLHSTVRAHLVGQHPPRYAGYTCWRGVASFSHEAVSAGISSETLGRGSRFGMLPIGKGRVFWYATLSTPAGGQDHPAGRKQTLLELFRAFRPPIVSLLEATDERAIVRHDIYDRRPVRRWGDGPVTLVGDAAHPPTPNQGQGACQAIEDALVLAQCLRSVAPGEVVAALRTYEARRRARTARIIRQSRWIGWFFQWGNPVACALREVVLQATTDLVIAPQFKALLADGADAVVRGR